MPDESTADVGDFLSVTGTAPLQAAWTAGDFVQRSGDTMTGQLTIEDELHLDGIDNAHVARIEMRRRAGDIHPKVRIEAPDNAFTRGFIELGLGGGNLPDVKLRGAAGNVLVLEGTLSAVANGASPGAVQAANTVSAPTVQAGITGFLGFRAQALGNGAIVQIGVGAATLTWEVPAPGEYQQTLGQSDHRSVTRTINANTNPDAQVTTIFVDTATSGGTVGIDLTPLVADGKEIEIKDVGGNASVNNISIQPGGANIDGVGGNRVESTDDVAIRLRSDGVDWWIMSYYP